MSANPLPRLTPAQCLETDRASDHKSEYYEGQMFARPGGTLPYARIAAYLIAALVAALRGSGCSVNSSDLRVGILPSVHSFIRMPLLFAGSLN